MKSQEKKARQFNIYFRDADEKTAAGEWATKQGHSSLNSYFLFLYRTDVRINGGGRLAGLDEVKAVALENRMRTAIEEEGQS